MSTRFSILTLGCKINQYETQSLREAWTAAGWIEARDWSGADVVCVNSCAVTAGAVRELRTLARRVARENPGARLILTGCAAQIEAEALAAIEGVSEVVPQSEKDCLHALPTRKPGSADMPSTDFPRFTVSSHARARAILKIQDGCSHCCTYCIVPRARGKSVSRPVADILDEAERLLAAGFGEIVLSGVNLRQFGDASHDLWDLILLLQHRFAPKYAGQARLRISSLDPAQLGDKALRTLRASSLVAPHLHLSLQSLSPAVLARMNRAHYAPEAVSDFIARLASVWPVFGLGCDLIAGFPGESAEDHIRTLEAMKALPLSYAHVFPYSARPGTLAAAYAGQLPAQLKKERAAELRDVARQKKQAFARRLAELPMLAVALESAPGKDEGQARGTCEFYVECELCDHGPSDGLRRLVPAQPLAARDGRLIVKPALHKTNPTE